MAASKPTSTFNWKLLAALCWLATSAASAQSEMRLVVASRIDPLQQTADSVYHDLSTETIDFFFEAWEGNRHFWDFDDDNLFAEEIIDGQVYPLPIVFQSKLSVPELFGDRSVYQIKTRSTENYHRGERTYRITWHTPGDKEKVLATAELNKNWSLLGAFSLVSQYCPLDLLVLCLLILALLLLILSELLPWAYVQRFVRRYVMPYSKVQGTGRKLNPITGKPLQPNEQVVKMCDREICCIPLHVWRRRNYQCYHCPEQCDGNANIWLGRFFSQVGDSKKLNWLWFGTAGGALAWALHAGMELLPSVGRHQLLSMASLGLAVGISYSFMLAWVEELGQGRALSPGRLALRTLMGATLGALLFFGLGALKVSSSIGGLATPTVLSLASALTWLLFCTLLGLVLSFRSSITWGRGLLSGLLAGLVSALLYYGLPFLADNPEASLVRMLTLMLAGATLGAGIIQIVKQLDNVELQVISPSYRSGLSFSLDNFLRNGSEVIVGKDMKASTVRVKWEDEHVLARHASLKRSGNQVSIEALPQADLWIDGQRFKPGQRQKLKGGEIIALSREGKTAFKYLQKS